MLSSAFYRNKAAYVVGKIINGYEELPFVVPVLNEAGQLVLDAIVLEEEQLNILFSLSRAYFMVDMAVPSGYVKFLRRMMPTKARAELYTMLGLGRQGKTLFYRDLRQHLLHSQDTFVPAPGIQGQVMLVFTLPSYPYVFKVIKDVFGPSKETDRATVEAKFALVKHVDRVGRMADTLEFTDLALPRNRFSTELLDQLDELAPSMVENDDPLVIRHCYVERRMIPLNIYLDRATPAQLESAVRDYGNAIRDLAIANIFPGDMLWRNFGVTRHNRIVFYDYDEIEYLTDINFRRIPPAPNPEAELAAEPWYAVARHDVFPEEFATFLLGDPRLRERIPTPPRRPARTRVLAGMPTPDQSRRDRRLLPLPRSPSLSKPAHRTHMTQSAKATPWTRGAYTKKLTSQRLLRRRLVEAKLSVGEVLSIVVGGVVRAPEVQLVGHVVVPAVGVPRCRNVTGQSVHEDEEPACGTALGTRVVGGTVSQRGRPPASNMRSSGIGRAISSRSRRLPTPSS